ncbi:molybdopterin-guanine dinucleotide biosynthesis protein MobB [Geomicrobium sp. JCM 19039]|nr:molybdopterin-guanine dinucleotide biosynthesis protein MobB [Geomicrobium sp. JCM 19039]
MGQPCRIIQVVGYKNAGKTTLIEQITRELSSKNVTVGVVKHHGHGGELVKSADSARFFRAGASVSLVEGEGHVQIDVHSSTSSLDALIQLQQQLQSTSCVLVEGWKREDRYASIVIIRDEADFHLLKRNHIMIVITHVPIDRELDVPVFDYENVHTYVSYIVRYIMKGVIGRDVSTDERTH